MRSFPARIRKGQYFSTTKFNFRSVIDKPDSRETDALYLDSYKAAALVAFDETTNLILMVFEKKAKSTCFSLPKGKRESYDKDGADTVLREFREETNCDYPKSTPQFEFYHSSGKCLVYSCIIHPKNLFSLDNLEVTLNSVGKGINRNLLLLFIIIYYYLLYVISPIAVIESKVCWVNIEDLMSNKKVRKSLINFSFTQFTAFIHFSNYFNELIFLSFISLDSSMLCHKRNSFI
ncbi:NUDIX hydrolase [Patescibacteria group bacterium]|nr:NUDIX hydrolase [Patescibacteria group bacterium]